VTVDRSCYAAFGIDEIDVYEKSNGVTIRNLRAEQTFTSANGSPCWVVVGNNVLFENCSLVGSSQAARGIYARGTNITVRNCLVTGFLNSDGDGAGGRVGYGSELHGHNMLWENCTFIGCKTGTSTGSRDAMNSGAMVLNCYAFTRDTTSSAAFDAHANLLDDLKVIGCAADVTCKGVNVRNGKALISGCNFKTTATSSEGVTFVSLYESDVDHVVIQGNTCIRSGGASNNLVYLNTNTPNPTSHKNIVIENNRIENTRLFDTDGGAVTGLVINDNYGLDVEWAIGFDNCNVIGLNFSGNDLTVDNLLAAQNTNTSIFLSGANITKNKIALRSSSAGLMTFPVSGFHISLRDVNFSENMIDATNMNATNYMISLFNSVSEISRCKFTGNTMKRGANFRFMQCVGSASAKTQIVDFLWSNNIGDGGLSFVDSDLTRVSFANNIFHTTAIGNIASLTFSAVNNTPVIGNASITNNVFDSGVNAGNNGVIVFNGASTYVTPVVISDNQFRTAADIGRSVYATPSATNNQIDFRNNVARGRFEDASGTFAIAPVGNRVYGAGGQAWKGGVVITADGEAYSSAAPTSGTWERGNKVYAASPNAGGTVGWVCTTAGAPGTWKTFGAIAA
jgi:hypothetical protein